MIRDATRADWPAVLALNAAWVHYLSPMDEARLAALASASCYFRVVEQDGAVAAFLLAFRKGAPYDGAIFRRYCEEAEDFLYLDRIVVDARHHAHGLASHLYDDAEAFARGAGLRRILCEVYVNPPNNISLHFHDRRGFRETGRVEQSGKIASLLELALRA